jgi:hypothetical protein
MEFLDDLNGDPISLIIELNELKKIVLDGVASERVSNKLEEGKVEVIERFANIALDCIKSKHMIVAHAEKMLMQEDAADPVINIVMNPRRLEDTLEDVV